MPPVQAAALAALALSLATACSGRPPAVPTAASTGAPDPAPADQLLAPTQFDRIADRAQRSQALFVEVSRVLTHARCVNCHPPDDTPRQGETHALHDPPVLRGPKDRG